MAAVPIVVALTLAACGSSGSNTNNTNNGASAYGAPAAAAAPKPAASVAASVRVGHTKIGNVLVDGQGRTLYTFSKDTGAMSTCNGACASIWLPVTTSGSPKAGAGVSAAKLGTSKRSDGSTQVTWAGHPLYRYSGDSQPGQTAGQGLNAFGGVWHVVSVKRAHKPAHKQAAAVHATAPVHHAPAPAPAPAATPVTPKPMHSTPAPMHPAAPAPAPSTSGIPQNNGGDMDSDNNGGPSDGDGNI
jgi:predicted lipoprotein with Yx(FWY)xxD motif